MRFEINMGDVDTFLTAYLDDFNSNTRESTYTVSFLGVEVEKVTGHFEDERDAIHFSGAAKKAEALIKRLWSETP
jgi:hypothetical protein